VAVAVDFGPINGQPEESSAFIRNHASDFTAARTDRIRHVHSKSTLVIRVLVE